MNPQPLPHWDTKNDMHARAQPHLERLVKIWGLDVDSIITGGWTPEPVALKVSAIWSEWSWRCEVPGLRSLQKSEFHVSSGKYALEWNPFQQKFKLLAYGDQEGANKWAYGDGEHGSIYTLFRRNCWLSGSPIPFESQHERLEWLLYGREVKLSPDYLKRISK